MFFTSATSQKEGTYIPVGQESVDRKTLVRSKKSQSKQPDQTTKLTWTVFDCGYAVLQIVLQPHLILICTYKHANILFILVLFYIAHASTQVFLPQS